MSFNELKVQIDPGLGPGQTHVNVVGCTLKLENCRLFPLCNKCSAGKYETDTSHNYQQQRDRQEHIDDKALLECPDFNHLLFSIAKTLW